MGLMLTLLTGMVWGGIGVVLSLAVRKRLNVLPFMAAANALASVGAWMFLVKWGPLLDGRVEHPLSLVLLLSMAGIAATIGMLFLLKAMDAGAAAWTVGQSAMVIPFLAGVLFWGEPLRMGGACGLAAILASLLAFAGARPSDTGDGATPNRRWLLQALLALVFLGAQQTLSSIPSSWEGWKDSAELRGPLILTAGALPLLFLVIRRRLWPERDAWWLAGLYAGLGIAGNLLLFAAMDSLRTEGRLALVFPLALGTCIVLVALCDIVLWKRRPCRFAWIGIALGTLGVILLAL